MIHSSKLFPIFILLLFAGFFSCQNTEKIKCEKEVYLIPEGFRGIILIFYDQPDGLPAEYLGDTRVYKVPKSGLMKSQFRPNGGCMSDERIHFFYVDSSGNQKPITYFMNLKENKPPIDENYVMLSFLSNKTDSTHFVIHLVGEVKEFVELTNAVRKMQPIEILKSLNP
jgi:hypothetical protein